MTNIKSNIVYLAAFAALHATPVFTWAKDLTHRLGAGYRNQFAVDLPSVAAQYYPTPDLFLNVALGVNTEESNSRLGLMARLNQIVFREENLHFYMGGGLGFYSQEVITGASQTSGTSGVELQGLFGVEFFLPGLDSLGISFESGIAIQTGNQVSFRTFADHPLRAGMTFYF